MSAMRLNLKLFTEPSCDVSPKELVPIFHGFIQRHAISHELLIDVADYTHVPDGPGIVLIGHEGHYSYDRLQGQSGLSYSLRRAQIPDGFEAALRYGVRQLAGAASLLAAEPSLNGRLRLDPRRLQLQINDRLVAPNEPATWSRLAPDVRRALSALFDADVRIEPEPAGLSLFTLQVHSAKPYSTSELLARV